MIAIDFEALCKKYGLEYDLSGLNIDDYRDIVEDWLVRASKGAVDKDKAEELAMEYGEEICGAYDAGFTCQEEAEDILYNEGIL